MCADDWGPDLLPHTHHCIASQTCQQQTCQSQPPTRINKLLCCKAPVAALCDHTHLILSRVSLATLLSPPDSLTKACRRRSSSNSSKSRICCRSALIKVTCFKALLLSGDSTSCKTCNKNHCPFRICSTRCHNLAQSLPDGQCY